MSFSFNIREQIIIGITAIVVIAVVFTVLVFKPQFDRYSDARSRQKKELATQQTKQAELDGLKVAKQDAALTEAKSLSLSKRMPEEADLPSILVELDELGKEHNVKVLDITPATLVPNTGYSSIAIELKVAGSYFNVTDFLYGLVKMPREYTVGTVGLETEDTYPVLTASVNVTTYVYTPNSKAVVQGAAGGGAQ